MISDLQVIVIGGPPGAGKTTLGRALAARLGFGSPTVDDLAITGRAKELGMPVLDQSGGETVDDLVASAGDLFTAS